MTLLAVGFFAAKLTPGLEWGGAFQSAGLTSFGGASVRNVATQPDGTVHIVLDETRQRTVTGNREDRQIRALLVAAAREGADPGVRADTVTILVGCAAKRMCATFWSSPWPMTRTPMCALAPWLVCAAMPTIPRYKMPWRASC